MVKCQKTNQEINQLFKAAGISCLEANQELSRVLKLTVDSPHWKLLVQENHRRQERQKLINVCTKVTIAAILILVGVLVFCAWDSIK